MHRPLLPVLAALATLAGIHAAAPGPQGSDAPGSKPQDAAPQGAPAATPAHPDVLLILADDLGWHDVSMHGSTFYRTPNIDRLAAAGVRFTNAYATPFCSPTRASILTGQDPARLGFTLPMGHLRQEVLEPELMTSVRPDMRALEPTTATRISFDHETLAEAFRDAGYETALFGKWHLGWKPHDPAAHGFQVVVDGSAQPGPRSYFPPYGLDELDALDDGEAGKDDRYLTEELTDRFLAWAGKEHERPTFACLWFHQVHAPFQARAKLRDEAVARVDPADPQRCPTYAAMVHSLDDAVGRVLDALEASGKAGDTIVVFASDNGGNEYDTVYGDAPVGLPPTRNLPFRGGKGTLWEGGVREPFAFRWPGHLPAGKVTDALASVADLYPTLLALAGLPLRPEQHLDGVSLVPALTGDGTPRTEWEDFLPHLVSITGNRPGASVRVGDWKLLRWFCDGPDGADRQELYDLAHDPGETTDRAADEPERVAALAKRLDAYLARTKALLPKPNPGFEPETERWHAGQGVEARYEGDVLLVGRGADEPFVATPFVPPIEGRAAFELEARCEAKDGAAVGIELHWATRRDPRMRRTRGVSGSIPGDGAWHAVRLELETGGALAALRLDVAKGEGTVALRSLRLRNVGEDVVRAWRP